MSGFTKWDLLAVIVIIALLLGMLFPWLNRSTDNGGRRAVCMNNQSQLALALLNYDSAKGELPGWRQKLSNGREISWIIPLLPFIEYSGFYVQLTEDPEEGEDLLPIPDLRIKSLLCPSADNRDEGNWASFVASCGKMDAEFSAVAPDNPGGHVPDAEKKNGVFFDYFETETKMSIDRISELKGTGNTIFVSENVRPWRWNELPRENLLGFCWPDPSFLNQQRDVCRGTGAPVVPVLVNLCKDGDPAIDHGRRPGLGEYRFSRPASNHPGIVLAAFCDRSVRPVNERIDPVVFEKLMLVDIIDLDPDLL